jgi:hypothetical protein
MQESDLKLIKKARSLIAELTGAYATLHSENVEELTSELQRTVEVLSEKLQAVDKTQLSKEEIEELISFVHDLESLLVLEREVLSFYESVLSPNVQTYGPSGRVNKK